jgi:MinD-like ATPase involved in chromosome partitioning or flagellar assembly
VTQIITFYSFKGGVGRTMALVNTAHALAKQGARVLMVDFDLEAPGMTHFFGKAVRRRRKGVARDALDLLLEAKHSYQEIAKGGNPLAAPLTLDDYTVHLKLPPSVSSPESPYLDGRVDLLPATLEPRPEGGSAGGKLSTDYLDRIAALDLAGIFGPEGPGHLFGKHVGDYFRLTRFRAPGDLVFALRDPVYGAYDFVLVDSRTGLNEISGLCIGPLCDSLVVCTGLNEQNVAGTRYFLERTGLLDKKNGKPYLVVVGPVPPWRSAESAARIAAIRKSLAAEKVFEIPYHPTAALVERVFVFDEPAEPIAASFEALGERMAETRLEALRALGETLSQLERPRGPDSSELLRLWQSLGATIPGSYRLMAGAQKRLGAFARPPFPTLLQSTLLLSSRNIRSEVELLALAVGVAVHRRPSLTLTERVVRLLDVPPRGEERERLLASIAFFFSRLQGARGGKLFSEHLTEADRRQLAKVMSGESASGWVGLALRHVCGGSWSDTEIEKAAGNLESAFYQSGYSRLFWPFKEGPPKLNFVDLWRANYMDVGLPANSTAQVLVSALESEPAWGETKRALSPRDVWDSYRWNYEERGPPGFSMVLAAAAVIAAVEGSAAVKSVLACLEAGRLIHGYAWRVLVNWKRLQPVLHCAAFKQFMAEEDAAIEEVERNFDRGVWPL